MFKKITALFIVFALTLAAAPVFADTETELYAYSFTSEVDESEVISPAESIELEWDNTFGRGDTSSLKVTHIPDTVYSSYANAVVLTLPEALPAGGVYRITASFYVPSEYNEGKETLTGPGFVINGDYSADQGVTKFPENFGTMPVDEWKTIDVTLPVQSKPINRLDFRFVINDEPKHADIWYIDDINIYQVGEIAEIRVPKWDMELFSLAEAYKDLFPFGNVMEPNRLDDADFAAGFALQFNSVTAENAMKPISISPSKGVYNFSGADKITNWALENGISVHGHTLAWHSQSSRWLNQENNLPLPREEARENLEEYITTVATHFKGRIDSWDVVNEAFINDGGEPSEGWKAALRQNDSPWYRAYANGADEQAGESGADYIYDAFVFARLADPGAKLYYNDFNEEKEFKRLNIVDMVTELNALWLNDERNTEPGRPLIEVIGMQSHFFTDTLDVTEVEDSIKAFIGAGVNVAVTELDVVYGSYQTFEQRTEPLSDEELQTQARLYAELFKIYIDNASHIEKVTIWGVSDNASWRGKGYPLLFDEYYSPKEAYWSVLNLSGEYELPERYMTEEQLKEKAEKEAAEAIIETDSARTEAEPELLPGSVIYVYDEDDEAKPGSAVLILVILAALACIVVIIAFATKKSTPPAETKLDETPADKQEK